MKSTDSKGPIQTNQSPSAIISNTNKSPQKLRIRGDFIVQKHIQGPKVEEENSDFDE